MNQTLFSSLKVFPRSGWHLSPHSSCYFQVTLCLPALTQKHASAQGIRGVCIYVVEGIQASETFMARTQAIEQLWINIRLKGGDLLTAGCIYRSPSGNAYQGVDEFGHLLSSVQAESPSHLICGDFNVPQIDWASSFCHAPDSHHAHKFLDVIYNSLLFQHVTQPTRSGKEKHLMFSTCRSRMKRVW